MGKAKDKKEKEDEFMPEVYAGQIMNCFSCDFSRLMNIYLLDDETVMTAAGNLVLQKSLKTGRVSWVAGKDGGGVGAVCVHPKKTCYAVAEKIGSQSGPADRPSVYIYSLPDSAPMKRLQKGTETYYTAAAFNASGDKLATVGGDPDYMLTVWNWELEQVILRFKAWGSEVFSVTFNPYDDGFLTTSGNGHIKFWEMAKTFTGLKLQGAIGKFGKTDIQDIIGYTELPDGKVLSGSQQGDLLMWEGNLLKVEIKDAAGGTCHDGPIEFVRLLEEDSPEGPRRAFVSAGNDGYMKYWRFGDIDMADSTDGVDGCAVKCLKSVFMGEKCCIRSVDKGTSAWVIQDANGAYWNAEYLTMDQIHDPAYKPKPATKLVSLHAGAVTCVEASPTEYCCVTGGKDGSVRLWAFLQKKELYSRHFSAGVSVLQWLPADVDPTASLIVAGFDNGIVRVLRKTAKEFELCTITKPHTAAITALAFSADHKWAVTTSANGFMFFFQVADIAKAWRPVGECELPRPASTAFWDKDKVVVGQSNGKVLAVHRPDPASIDPEVTFKFDCTYDEFMYNQRMKPPEQPKKDKKKDDGDDDDEDVEEEEEEEMVHDEGPLAVNAIMKLGPKLHNQLVVALQAEARTFSYMGMTWPKDGEDPPAEDPIMNVGHTHAVVKRLKMSPMGSYLIMACERGSVIIRDAVGVENASPLKKCFHMNLGHDGRPEVRQGGVCLPGTVLGVAMSYDESVLLTVSEDGSFLSYNLKDVPGAVMPPDVHEVKTKDWAPAAQSVPDVVEVDALSIQETKEKEDRDKAHAAAQQKKTTLADKVKTLQVDYQSIIDENNHAPPGKKMNKEELELDPEITNLLHEENARSIQAVVEEHSWETVRSEIAKEKLENTFIKCLKVDRIVLEAFASGKVVTSFRTPQLTSRQQEKICQVHDLIDSETARRNQAHSDPNDEPPKSPPQGGFDPVLSETMNTEEAGEGPISPQSPGLSAHDPAAAAQEELAMTKKSQKQTHVKSQLEKAEERKRQRAEGKAMYEKLFAMKPQADQEDPKDLGAIQRAERSMGDKRLKTDANYVVKDTERVTAERKERQLVLLEESVNSMRVEFNERFVAMRDLKERLVESINKDLKKIIEINGKLKLPDKVDLRRMQDEEMPDKLREEPPTKEQLLAFEKERAKARRKAEREAKAKAGFGGDLGGGDEEEDDDDGGLDETDRLAMVRRASLRTHTRRESHTISAEMRLNIELKTKLEKLPKSAIELEEEAILRQQLTYEKEKLERKIDKTVSTFDDALDELQREKFKLDGDLKMADMRILLLYRELVLLKEFKKKDEQLMKKLDGHKAEKLEVTKKTNECQERLNEKMVEIKQLAEREMAIMNEMKTLLMELPQAIRDKLMDIFKKKVKRKAKKGDGEDEEEEEEESSDSDWVSDEDEEGGEEVEDMCPEGCDEEVYDEVLRLREHKLDQEDIVQDFYKAMEQLKRENESLTKREKATNTKLLQVEKEIQNFQTEKQQKLNQLETSIILKLSQVQCLNEDNRLPLAQDDLVVFTNEGMKDLCRRIVQLQSDKKALNREHNEHRKTHRSLHKEKVGLKAHVSEWEQRVVEVQLLKFGQAVDLEKLEDVSVDRQTEELKEALRLEEASWERAMRVQVQAMKQLKEQQQHSISENSRLLQELADLQNDQQKLEEHLNVSQNKILTRMAGGSRIATAADRSNLKDLVVMQQREIDALKSEIAMLRRKGGHVYTPVVTKVMAATNSQPAPGANGTQPPPEGQAPPPAQPDQAG
eukprot:TRINITY_DN1602_c0_g1_i1.p1 TRINITY_DN1602_c0_g1~~TRINITY_DN1602_c0_g1_i1.p1  ORF type:complete len:1770 (+),score=916.72 TRINITY_DN1602_c0_g1_i1:89-5398(+)